MKPFKLFFLFSLLLLYLNCTEDNPVIPVPSPITTGNILDSTIINNLIAKINAGDYDAIHSLLIYKDDTLIVEKYFRGYDREDLHVCCSVTKSVASAMMGIAIEDGYINSVEDTLLNFFPEYTNIQNPGEWKSSVTLNHILAMSAGFRWDEFTLPYTDPNNDVRKLIESNDWIKYVLDLPVIYQPGTYFTYNSGCSTLFAGILLNKTGMNAKTFGMYNLFNPLGIDKWFWEQGPNNITNTFGGLELRPVDMMKFGKLYLQRGNWTGEQVIKESWIDFSTSTKISISSTYEYAYQWWRYTNASSTGQALQVNDVYFALGWGGQHIFVVPHLNMVVVVTAGNFATGNEPRYFFKDYILPAAYAVEGTYVYAE